LSTEGEESKDENSLFDLVSGLSFAGDSRLEECGDEGDGLVAAGKK